MLTIFTIIVCVASYFININAFSMYFFYVMGFAIVKGFLSNTLKDVFNIRKVKDIYNEVGFMNSLDSFISLLFITVYYVFREYEQFSMGYLVPTVLCYILIYRFLFWDMTYKISRLWKEEKA